MKAKTVSYFLIVLFCNTLLMAADVPGDFNAAVRTAVKDFQEALTSKDAARLGGLYAQDAIAFPPNADMLKGREAIQAFWKGLMDIGFTGQLETLETENQGDLGFEVGTYKILGADGKMVDQGKYVVVYKKEDGAWKLYRDIWNTSMPAPAAP